MLLLCFWESKDISCDVFCCCAQFPCGQWQAKRHRNPKLDYSISVYSAYFDDLSVEDKSNYRNKLTLTDGNVLQDTLTLKLGWKNDVSFLPDVGWPDIYNYLVNTPREFTKESLKVYKSLEAYNFFRSGHVQDVFCHPIEDTEFCFLKSIASITI